LQAYVDTPITSVTRRPCVFVLLSVVYRSIGINPEQCVIQDD